MSIGWKRCCLYLSFFLIGSLCYSSVLGAKFKSTRSYVVIGAFSFEKNAERFTSFANEKELEATYEINAGRNLFYVYVFVSDDREIAYKELLKIKGLHPEFKDAWVFEGQLGSAIQSVQEREIVSIEKMPSQKIELPSEEERANPKNTEEMVAPMVEAKESKDQIVEESVKNVDDEESPLNKEEGVYHLYFNLLNAKKLKEVKGKVKVIDAERSKQLLVAKSHEIVDVRNPNNGSNRIKVASDIFGFRDVQYMLDLENPLTDSTSAYVETIGDSIIVNFMLERYKKGDVLVMYNVYFYRDAAIMKNESIYELNSLLDMLQENENYKVKIHGHTNGNSHGKIIHLDPDDKNFFALKAKHLETDGTAKKLSLYRAYTIQHWLMDQGIPEERMQIKGWGGKKMLYDKHDTQADQNVRVEIEILEE